jgi:hypothetical protein
MNTVSWIVVFLFVGLVLCNLVTDKPVTLVPQHPGTVVTEQVIEHQVPPVVIPEANTLENPGPQEPTKEEALLAPLSADIVDPFQAREPRFEDPNTD